MGSREFPIRGVCFPSSDEPGPLETLRSISISSTAASQTWGSVAAKGGAISVTTQLPAQPTPLVGRDREVAALHEPLLRPDVRGARRPRGRDQRVALAAPGVEWSRRS